VHRTLYCKQQPEYTIRNTNRQCTVHCTANSSHSCTDRLHFFLHLIFLHLYSITMGHFRPKHVVCCQTILVFRKRKKNRPYILAVLLIRFTSTKHIEKSSFKIFCPVFGDSPISNQSRDTKCCGFSCFSSVPPQQFRDSTFTLRHDRFLPHPSYFINIQPLYTNRGTWCRSWFRHCATSRRVVSSITYGVKGIFHLHNPPGHTMALGSTKPLTEISIRNTFWGVKEAGA
jgi:hypothetical protein